MNKLKEVAEKYIGQTEISGNKGFNDKKFEKKLKEVGWDVGLAWCSFFAEACAKEAYPEKVKELDKLFSGSATATYKNFELAGYKVSQTPEVGNLAVWRYGNTWKGHIGIVVETTDTNYKTVEGNTNDGKGRECYIVAKHSHSLFAPLQPAGLNLIGFINPVK